MVTYWIEPKEVDETCSDAGATGAGRLRTMQCDDNIEHVEQLALSQEDKRAHRVLKKAATLNTACPINSD